MLCSSQHSSLLESDHIFFSPHSDDVVLSCGGLVARLARQHHDVRVITVFSSETRAPASSAFARHLRAKWGMSADRREEDRRALGRLGVDRVEVCNLDDAPWRKGPDGDPLYASYEELCGPVSPADAAAITDVLRSLVAHALREVPASATLYFPLAVGGHVDHRHLFQVGLEMLAAGYRVRFYEDWPYVEAYAPRAVSGWQSRTVAVDGAPKLAVVGEYRSQVRGLDGTPDGLRRRVDRFMRRRGVRGRAERYWEVSSPTDDCSHPFERIEPRPRLRDFGKFLRTLRWRHLDGCLPVGRGYCVDAGCGTGRHRRVIEAKGYHWIGLDRGTGGETTQTLRADCQALPLAASSAAAVVSWQVMEYTRDLDRVVSEASRVLECGGVFCGSVAFLEPVHGESLWGISPLGLRRLLEERGFRDVEIMPGLSAFSLMAWTGARRFLGAWSQGLALRVSGALLIPPAAARFVVSWLAYTLGLGTGFGMRWLTQRAPLEFAGQLVFVARKPARPRLRCTSGS
jgi:LmbE family N-acetylglucosaminyl deacetylase